jgi:DNA-binding response OmpR family regulator
MMRILVVEDERTLSGIMQKRLKREGYSVDCAFDGEEAILYIEMGAYDCIILDILLPKKNGLNVLKKIRENNLLTPVLILTAKDSVNDRVAGLDAGADDYMIKPFSYEEFSARVRSLLRRNAGQKSTTLIYSDLKIDTVNKTVYRGDAKINLSGKEFALLEYMMRNPARTLSRGQIIDHIWSFDFDSDSNIVDVYISYLRNKIDGGREPKLIRTVRGTGYVLKDNDE